MKRWQTLVFPAFLLCLTGCTTERVTGDSTVYTFAWWVPALVLLGSILAMGVGILLSNHIARLGWGLMIGGLTLLVLLVPGLFLDYVLIDGEHLELRTGLWFMPTYREVRFADLRQVDIVAKSRMSRSGVSTNYSLECQVRLGHVEQIPIGDLMRGGPADHFLEVVRGRGIPVVDRTGGL